MLIKDLPEDARGKAIANTLRFIGKYGSELLSEDAILNTQLGSAFDWYNSLEGRDYWHRMDQISKPIKETTMNAGKFKSFLDSLLASISATLGIKAGEYANNSDRLHNFKKAARIANKHPAEVLDGMLLKHYTAYQDMIEKVKDARECGEDATFTQALLDERFGDIINYFILQKAVLQEMCCEETI